uniref:C-type lectin domain-containing protein n=1 Tax=Hucho hucho TaxID=62062 RepID=A0A4W5PLN3_9TELE
MYNGTIIILIKKEIGLGLIHILSYAYASALICIWGYCTIPAPWAGVTSMDVTMSMLLHQWSANAESYCVSEGANLASVHSDFDPAERPIWIGLSDIHMEGRWMWSDGSKVDFTKWHEKQPNGGVTENCVTTHYSGPKWFDRDCNSNLYSFVCAELRKQ